MPITTSCPHCGKAYRLKDELAGKRVACGNPNCRQSFQVPATSGGVAAVVPTSKPQPTTQATKAPPTAKQSADAAKSSATSPANGKTSAPPPPIDAEALAAAALADEPTQTTPDDERTLAITCPVCDTKWDVPWAMQGKNVLCPECRHRQKVPEQKVAKPADWRDPNAGGPSMRKIEELEGVQASTGARMAGGQALKQAGVLEPEYEPRPVSFYVKLAALAILVFGGGGYGVVALIQGRRDNRQDTYMADAVKKMGEVTEPTFPAAELPLFKAAVQIAAGEFAAGKRESTDKDLDEAIKHFNAAKQELETANKSTAREMLVGELALRWVALGGTDEEIGAGRRLPWIRPPSTTRGVQLGKAFNVQEELGRVLALLKQDDKKASLDVRLDVARRVAHVLAERGQPDVVGGVVPQAFEDADQAQAAAEVAAETLRVTGDAPHARNIVEELRPVLAGKPVPAAVQAIIQSGDSPIPGLMYAGEPKSGEPSDLARQSFVTLDLLQKKDAEALELAKRGSQTTSKVRALALVAEWSANPAEAVAAATDAVTAEVAKKEKASMVPDVLLIRIARQAGRAGQREKADALVAGTKDDGAKAWIKAEALRYALISRGDGPSVEESVTELPADPKEYRVGHGWGRLALARFNARVGDVPGTYEGWGASTFQPFGLAGMALGRQDRNRP